MSADREFLYQAGLDRMLRFCARNSIPAPAVTRLRAGDDRRYYLGTCAYYRPREGIVIMVEKCANRGYGGHAWSWPAYAVDRTPFGVIQHELGHHVDHCRSEPAKSREDVQSLFSWKIHAESKEPALTGYLGTDERAPTFFMEWFAENFRLFVTNPDLCRLLRPRFHAALLAAGLKPVTDETWEAVFRRFEAPERIVEQARKKIGAGAVTPAAQAELFA